MFYYCQKNKHALILRLEVLCASFKVLLSSKIYQNGEEEDRQPYPSNDREWGQVGTPYDGPTCGGQGQRPSKFNHYCFIYQGPFSSW